MTMRKGCATAAIMQCIIQVIVAVIVILRWGWKLTFKSTTLHCHGKPEFKLRTKGQAEHKKLVLALLTSWFCRNLNWGHFLSEVTHLGLLALAGYGMMEAIGHSELHTWQPMVMYNTGVVYSWLTLCAMLSSILRQVAYTWMDPKKVRTMDKLKGEKTDELTMECEIWYSLEDISDDWRWQRVFGQLGVLVLLGTYLSFVDDVSGGGMDQIAGLVLAATVVACIWSFGVCAVVSFRSLRHILAQAFKFDIVSDKLSEKFSYVSRRHRVAFSEAEGGHEHPASAGNGEVGNAIEPGVPVTQG